MKKNYRELINSATDKELQNSLYLTQVMILIISFILGMFLFDDLAEFIDSIYLGFTANHSVGRNCRSSSSPSRSHINETTTFSLL